MNRKDMQPGVLYAISAGGYNTRPGVITDAGKAPNKCRAQIWWTWPGQDDDYLNAEPPITEEGAKYDIKMVLTSEVRELWSEYCARVKAERKAALDKKQAEEDAAEAKRQADIARVAAVAPKAGSLLSTLEWVAKSGDRMSTYHFSANDVLNLIEQLTADTQVSQ